MKEVSSGKDTITGHWEMMGLVVADPFRTYPNGFPPEVIEEYERRIGRKTLGNKPASGTVILDELGEEHMRTGAPIVYTSADSVFQVAAHEEVIPIEELWRICEIARELMRGEHNVGRIIARPFVGPGKGEFKRTANRKDFSVKPTGETVVERAHNAGKRVIGLGKIADIFDRVGIDEEIRTQSNSDGMRKTIDLIRESDASNDLHEPGRLRFEVRPPQRRRRLREGAGDVRRRAGRAARSNCAPTTSSSSPPITAAIRATSPPTTRASTCRCSSPDRQSPRKSPSARATPSPTSARRSADYLGLPQNGLPGKSALPELREMIAALLFAAAVTTPVPTAQNRPRTRASSIASPR